jgi:hypothetical protein
MQVIIIVVPQFWHLRLPMIFSGLGINWGWGIGSSCFGWSVTGLSATDAWHRAESVIGIFSIYPSKVWSKWITFKRSHR